MNTTPLTHDVPPPTAAERITYGAVHLDVTHRERSLAFWRDALGLELMAEDEDGIVLGAAGHPVIVLHPGATRGWRRGHAGLYHVAVHVPDVGEFARAMARLAEHRIAQAPTDHIFSMATYATGPDALTLEITLETPERFGSFAITPDSIEIIDDEGRRRGPTESLDVGPVLEHLPATPIGAPLAPGARVGHVHLHVPDMDESLAFYRDVIGFEEHMVMPSVGMSDLSAGGRFPHRLAMNTWFGPGIEQPPAGTAGMRRFELLVDAAALAGIRDRAPGATAPDDGGLELRDPGGNTVRIGVA